MNRMEELEGMFRPQSPWRPKFPEDELSAKRWLEYNISDKIDLLEVKKGRIGHEILLHVHDIWNEYQRQDIIDNAMEILSEYGEQIYGVFAVEKGNRNEMIQICVN